jgi:hypothetical protein
MKTIYDTINVKHVHATHLSLDQIFKDMTKAFALEMYLRLSGRSLGELKEMFDGNPDGTTKFVCDACNDVVTGQGNAVAVAKFIDEELESDANDFVKLANFYFDIGCEHIYHNSQFQALSIAREVISRSYSKLATTDLSRFIEDSWKSDYPHMRP